MANLSDLIARARNSASGLRAKELAKNDYKLIFDLVRLRNDRGMSQKDVAEILGVSQQAVSKLESQDGDPRLSTLRRYAQAIGALVGHVVEPDEGQLLDGGTWNVVTYSVRPAPAQNTYPVPAMTRSAYAEAA